MCSPKVFEYSSEALKRGKSELSDAVRLAALSGDAEVVDVSGLFWENINTVQDFKRGKRAVVERAQKGRGASDFVAHYVNKPIENKIVYHLSDSRVTPNQLTIATNLVAYCVTALFLFGHLLTGSILTFFVGIMDGLDGKLARVRRRTTRLGIMEHPFDMLFEFSWLIALSLYLSRSGGSLPLVLCTVTLTLIAFYRFCYDQFGRAMKISLDVYAPFERAFRRIAGRRNLYNIHILVGALIKAPLYSLIGILCHAALTAVVYAYRACRHLYVADR
ncbi:MAG: CDP-alcohol phosphatidyltransferase family protein [Candidatus Geothermarchaeales archaeon]